MAVVGDIYSVKVVCRVTPVVAGSVVSLNVLHYRVSQVLGTPKNDQEIADAMDAFWGPKYIAYLVQEASYRGVLVQKIRPLPISIAFDATANQGVGTRVGGDLLPPQICGMITKQTGGAGRAKRGRVYMPFPGEDDSTDSVPSAGFILALTTILPNYLSGITVGVAPNTTDLLPVIFHRVLGTTDDLAFAVARTYFTTQRRRSPISGADISPVG